MYDVDGNGVIDIQEMTKIVQVSDFFSLSIVCWVIQKCIQEELRKQEKDKTQFLFTFSSLLAFEDSSFKCLNRFFFSFCLIFIQSFMTKENGNIYVNHYDEHA